LKYTPQRHERFYKGEPTSLEGKETTNGKWTIREARDFSSTEVVFPFDKFPAVSLVHTCSVFRNHLSFWGRPECQAILEEQLLSADLEHMDKGALLQVLDSMPELIQQLEKRKDVHGLAFVYKLNDKLLQKIQDMNNKGDYDEHIGKLNHFFQDGNAISKIEELAVRYTDIDMQRVIYSEMLGLMYDHHRAGDFDIKSPENMQRIYKGYIKLQQAASDPSSENPLLIRQCQQLTHVTSAHIASMNNDDKKAFVRGLMQQTAGIEADWDLAKEGFPGFVAHLDGKNHFVDIVQGLHIVDGISLGPLPASIARNPLLSERFPFLGAMGVLQCQLEIKMDKTLNSPLQVYSPLKYPDYQIVYDPKSTDNQVRVLRKLTDENGKEQWCQFVETDSLFLSEAETKTLEEEKAKQADADSLMPKDIKDFKKIKQRFDEAKVDDLASDKKLDKRSMSPYIQSAIGKKQCWVSITNPNKVLVTPAKGNACVGVLTMRTYAGSKGLAKAVGVPKNIGKVDSWIAVDHDKSIKLLETSKSRKRFKSYEGVEAPERILAYGKRGNITKLEFPHLKQAKNGEPLSYRVKGENVELDNSPGYFLQEEKAGSGFLPKGYRNYNLFENARGEQKVIIAGRQFSSLIDKGDDRKLNPDVVVAMKQLPGMDENDKPGTDVAYEFSVEPHTNKLKSASADGYLYLSYLCLAQRDYASALHYLEKARPSTEYSDEYKKMASWIRTSDDRSLGATEVKLLLELQIVNKMGTKVTGGLSEEEREEAIATAAKEYDHLHGLIARDPSLADSGLYQTFAPRLEEVSDMLAEASDAALPRAVSATSKQPTQLEPKTISTHSEKLPGHLQSFALHLYSEASLPKNEDVHLKKFVVEGKEWILKDFFTIAEKLKALDSNSVEFRELVHAIETAKLESPKYEQAQFYLLHIAKEKVDVSVEKPVTTSFKKISDALKQIRQSDVPFQQSMRKGKAEDYEKSYGKEISKIEQKYEKEQASLEESRKKLDEKIAKLQRAEQSTETIDPNAVLEKFKKGGIGDPENLKTDKKALDAGIADLPIGGQPDVEALLKQFNFGGDLSQLQPKKADAGDPKK